MGIEYWFYFGLKWIIGPVVGIFVTLLVAEPAKQFLAPMIIRFGSRKREGPTGRWQTTFTYVDKKVDPPSEVAIIQVIEVSTLLGSVVGRIIPHASNQGEAKKFQALRPLRVSGSVKDNNYFTGVWLHPDPENGHRGAFCLKLLPDNQAMVGMWLGYSPTGEVVETNRWHWVRLTR
jgi:hypothetical protein